MFFLKKTQKNTKNDFLLVLCFFLLFSRNYDHLWFSFQIPHYSKGCFFWISSYNNTCSTHGSTYVQHMFNTYNNTCSTLFNTCSRGFWKKNKKTLKFTSWAKFRIFCVFFEKIINFKKNSRFYFCLFVRILNYFAVRKCIHFCKESLKSWKLAKFVKKLFFSENLRIFVFFNKKHIFMKKYVILYFSVFLEF